MKPLGSVTAAAGWRAVFESDQNEIVALPVAFWNLYDLGGSPTVAVVLAPSRKGFVEVTDRTDLIEENAHSAELKGWILRGYASPGESLVYWKNEAKKSGVKAG